MIPGYVEVVKIDTGGGEGDDECRPGHCGSELQSPAGSTFQDPKRDAFPAPFPSSSPLESRWREGDPYANDQKQGSDGGGRSKISGDCRWVDDDCVRMRRLLSRRNHGREGQPHDQAGGVPL